jgi:ArsR family transcriptional regulator
MFGERFDLFALAGLFDKDWVVGDLGCGTGQIAQALAPFVARVIAVESSRAMLRAARQRVGDLPNVELRLGELETLPIDDESLDVAAMCLVLHHLPDPLTVLREAARVLRPGGRVHVWLGFEREQVATWLAGVGYRDVRIQPLPADAQAKGPSLFAASARRAASATSRVDVAPYLGAGSNTQPNARYKELSARAARGRAPASGGVRLRAALPRGARGRRPLV